MTGLAAAYDLVASWSQVTVVEAADSVGGLAKSMVVGSRPVERYYHFICREDKELIDFIVQLGIADKLKWREGKVGYFVGGRVFGLNNPLDVLSFAPVPFMQRLKFGMHVFLSQYRTDWVALDKIPAKQWLVEREGAETYASIWDPLLQAKFGAFHDKVSAAWIWQRIYRVARSRTGLFGKHTYGFLQYGCHSLISALLDSLPSSGQFTVLRRTRVERVLVENGDVSGVSLADGDRFLPADGVISTIAIPDFLKLVSLPPDYAARLAAIEYLHVICVLLQMQRPITENFWLNVNDPQIGFNAIVDTINLNPRPDFRGDHFAYIPFYVHHSDPRWGFDDQKLFKECTDALRKIRPDFSHHWIKRWWVSRDRHAQAVCSIGFLDLLPSHETPVSRLYITDSTQYYPEDRTLSASIKMGRRVASLMKEGLK